MSSFLQKHWKVQHGPGNRAHVHLEWSHQHCVLVSPKTQLQMKQQAQHCIKHVHSHKTQCGVNVKIVLGFVKKSITEQQFERMDIEEQKHSTCANRHSGLHGACSHQFELPNTRWADLNLPCIHIIRRSFLRPVSWAVSPASVAWAICCK